MDDDEREIAKHNRRLYVAAVGMLICFVAAAGSMSAHLSNSHLRPMPVAVVLAIGGSGWLWLFVTSACELDYLYVLRRLRNSMRF